MRFQKTFWPWKDDLTELSSPSECVISQTLKLKDTKIGASILNAAAVEKIVVKSEFCKEQFSIVDNLPIVFRTPIVLDDMQVDLHLKKEYVDSRDIVEKYFVEFDTYRGRQTRWRTNQELEKYGKYTYDVLCGPSYWINVGMDIGLIVYFE